MNSDEKYTQELVELITTNATKLGISIVQTMAEKTLAEKPGYSLKMFTQLLDQQLVKMDEKFSD